MIAGLRHRLVHDYDGTNWNIIVEVVFEEIPALIVQIEKFQKNAQLYVQKDIIHAKQKLKTK